MNKEKLRRLYTAAETYACWLGTAITLEAASIGFILRGDLPVEWYTFPLLAVNAIAILLIIRALLRADKEFEDELK